MHKSKDHYVIIPRIGQTKFMIRQLNPYVDKTVPESPENQKRFQTHLNTLKRTQFNTLSNQMRSNVSNCSKMML